MKLSELRKKPIEGEIKQWEYRVEKIEVSRAGVGRDSKRYLVRMEAALIDQTAKEGATHKTISAHYFTSDPADIRYHMEDTYIYRLIGPVRGGLIIEEPHDNEVVERSKQEVG